MLCRNEADITPPITIVVSQSLLYPLQYVLDALVRWHVVVKHSVNASALVQHGTHAVLKFEIQSV